MSLYHPLQVLLCDADFSRPSMIAQTAARFASLVNDNNTNQVGVAATTVKPPSPPKRDIFDTSDLEFIKKPKPDADAEPSTTPTGDEKLPQMEELAKHTFNSLMDQQAAAFRDLKTVSSLFCKS